MSAVEHQLEAAAPGFPFTSYIMLDEHLVPLDIVYNLSTCYAAVADVSSVPNWSDKDLKVVIKFTNSNQDYWCIYEWGGATLSLVGSRTLTFSGFNYSEKNGRVRRVGLEEGDSCYPAFNVAVFKASTKRHRRGRDVIDGSCRLQEREEMSAEAYLPTADYVKGSRVAQFYILFHDSNK